MRLFVMTGDFMTGKTTWIEKMLITAGLPLESANPQVRQWQRGRNLDRLGLDIAGVYTPAVFEDGVKTGIDATLLPECLRFMFATRRNGFQEEGKSDIGRPGKMPKKLGWNFDDEALARINRHFALTETQNCDLLIIDELGPLELMRGEGYTEGLALLDSAAVPAALLVIRPSLLDVARERWGEFEVINTNTDISEFLQSFV